MPYQKNKDFHKLLEKVDSCLENDYPFSIYRKPLESKVFGVFQSNDELNITTDFEDKGFVFAPFDLNDNAVLIHADEVLEVFFEKEGTTDDIKTFTNDSGKYNHLKLVEKGINKIGSGALTKVVLSRKIAVKLSRSPKEIFISLLSNYPNAFCYLFFHPKVGIWCGATPETLVRIAGGELETMSLAATLPIKENSSPNWGSKEIEEQKMVSDYIKEKLVHSLEEFNMGKAESIVAGDLWHLKSDIKGKLSATAQIKDIITSLHPTPAVCGIPTSAAKAFIVQNESYKRTYYTGFLGELNLNKEREMNLFVNLRCMEISDQNASIFVGGGITSASNPEREWSETQNKSKTMLNII
ncbi:isochorismate synthase [Flagellimonas aquimarina]|uniref:isochorismate synthase n=1 Tax=Flagellimonas aquimarina TaxID=2201895 RepID=A0A316L2A7_9FLAO|nr:chorismate-binding protein [Allomuricauda koreensis]PWL39085.1 isochorismate synthase [Allomuricauda koreensis]